KALMEHADFTMNPNRVRAVISQFAVNNPEHFHREDGEGYRFIADQILSYDKSDPGLASRFVDPLNNWEQQNSTRQQAMLGELVRILETPGVSENVLEKVKNGVKLAHEKGVTERGKEALEKIE